MDLPPALEKLHRLLLDSHWLLAAAAAAVETGRTEADNIFEGNPT